MKQLHSRKRNLLPIPSFIPMFSILILLALAVSAMFTGCASAHGSVPECTILMEDNPALYFSGQVYEVKRFHDLSLTVGVPKGERISSSSYENYTISPKTGSSQSYDYYTLTLHQVRYPAVVRLDTAPAHTTEYHPGGGFGEVITVPEDSPHLYDNALPYRRQFTREGYLPVGWNTSADGSGTHIGFGSRFDHTKETHMRLSMEWLPCTPAREFTYTLAQEEITITGYHGRGSIVMPPQIDGYPVTRIASNAFFNIHTDILALPATLKEIEKNAFRELTVTDFYLFDNIETFTEESFQEYEITHLHINAVNDPVYSGSYFDTLPDKADYLSSLEGKPKIVLFCGSSARFGYDSALIEAAFPDYHVVNMGVYAYSNMLPLSDIVLSHMGEGDILLSSPELDAIDNQFCGETALDKETFCMMESNYDMYARLDSRKYTNLFGALSDYLNSRKNMETRSYQDSPAYYDEDGNLQDDFTYNRQGDYLVYRENNHSRKSFGIKRAYYNPDYIGESGLNGLNGVYDSFSQKGIRVFFTYSPRSSISISEDSTPETIRLLDQMLRDSLHAPVISSIEDSLMDPGYFYGTDNHLSTEGVQKHTAQVIEDLRRVI